MLTTVLLDCFDNCEGFNLWLPMVGLNACQCHCHCKEGTVLSPTHCTASCSGIASLSSGYRSAMQSLWRHNMSCCCMTLVSCGTTESFVFECFLLSSLLEHSVEHDDGRRVSRLSIHSIHDSSHRNQ